MPNHTRPLVLTRPLPTRYVDPLTSAAIERATSHACSCRYCARTVGLVHEGCPIFAGLVDEAREAIRRDFRAKARAAAMAAVPRWQDAPSRREFHTVPPRVHVVRAYSDFRGA